MGIICSGKGNLILPHLEAAFIPPICSLSASSGCAGWDIWYLAFRSQHRSKLHQTPPCRCRSSRPHAQMIRFAMHSIYRIRCSVSDNPPHHPSKLLISTSSPLSPIPANTKYHPRALSTPTISAFAPFHTPTPYPCARRSRNPKLTWSLDITDDRACGIVHKFNADLRHASSRACNVLIVSRGFRLWDRRG